MSLEIIPATPKVVSLKVRRGYYVLDDKQPIALAFTRGDAVRIVRAMEFEQEAFTPPTLTPIGLPGGPPETA